MNHATMRRRGFSPYGPSGRAGSRRSSGRGSRRHGRNCECAASRRRHRQGMIPDAFPQEGRRGLLDPAIIVPPLLWLASDASGPVTGRRLDASRWRGDLPEAEAAEAAMHEAGWANS